MRINFITFYYYTKKQKREVNHFNANKNVFLKIHKRK